MFLFQHLSLYHKYLYLYLSLYHYRLFWVSLKTVRLFGKPFAFMETQKAPANNDGGLRGATGRIRTGDLLITNQLRYRLRYSSILGENTYFFRNKTQIRHNSIISESEKKNKC